MSYSQEFAWRNTRWGRVEDELRGVIDSVMWELSRMDRGSKLVEKLGMLAGRRIELMKQLEKDAIWKIAEGDEHGSLGAIAVDQVCGGVKLISQLRELEKVLTGRVDSNKLRILRESVIPTWIDPTYGKERNGGELFDEWVKRVEMDAKGIKNPLKRHAFLRYPQLLDEEYCEAANMFAAQSELEGRLLTVNIAKLHRILSMMFVISEMEMEEGIKRRRLSDQERILLRMLGDFVYQTFEGIQDGADPRHDAAMKFVLAIDRSSNGAFWDHACVGCAMREYERVRPISSLLVVNRLFELGESDTRCRELGKRMVEVLEGEEKLWAFTAMSLEELFEPIQIGFEGRVNEVLEQIIFKTERIREVSEGTGEAIMFLGKEDMSLSLVLTTAKVGAGRVVYDIANDVVEVNLIMGSDELGEGNTRVVSYVIDLDRDNLGVGLRVVGEGRDSKNLTTKAAILLNEFMNVWGVINLGNKEVDMGRSESAVFYNDSKTKGPVRTIGDGGKRKHRGTSGVRLESVESAQMLIEDTVGRRMEGRPMLEIEDGVLEGLPALVKARCLNKVQAFNSGEGGGKFARMDRSIFMLRVGNYRILAKRLDGGKYRVVEVVVRGDLEETLKKLFEKS